MRNNNAVKRICVFCGSATGVRNEYTEAAEKLGKAIVSQDIGLVYGGGSVGLMGIIARTVQQENGEIIGVIPGSLFSKEVVFHEATRLYEVSSMHERKALMAKLSDAFIAIPGGYGTLDEFFEIVTWTQLGLHTKPIGILNVAGYFDLLLKFADHLMQEGFVQPKYRHLIKKSDSPEELLHMLIQQKKAPQEFTSLINWKEV